ncbi:Heat shock protein [Wickerhamomyces ciferrii]|uniref:Heat shock protein n=1 Tax=Wickerhamomyces ciferrii (strain ATCC 14091 / BCRC 22168 / CBS 111 / JCM 3599 / NBRC 0793 / NRRL Y-1031 F-60-10) TaxID=1206466 RepID=K0KTQ1_WICCF|nr:Heat shock protein [Wickerhamomyces ciferrii]CCH44638.1 Heat shock protein [Wickerhamomyces ciferrii]
MSADELKAQGNAAFAAKDYEKAIEFFSKAIEIAPTNHVLYSNRSASFASLKQFDKALQDAQKTIEINPTWAKGYSRVAAAYHGSNQLDDAEKSYQKALELDSSNKQAQDGLKSVQAAKSYANAGPGPDLGLGKLFNDPNLIENLKKNPKTSELMKDPSLVDKVIRMKNNPQSGAQDMLSDPRLMTIMATLLGVDLNDDSPVGAQANAASTPTPSSSSSSKESEQTSVPEPKKQKQEEPKKDKDGDIKIEEATDSTTSQKQKADESKAEGNKLYKQRKFDEAIAKYNEAFEINPDVTYLNNRAAAEFEKGDYESTIKTCEEAITKGREQRVDYKIIAKSFARIGTTYLKKQDYQQAINFFEKSLTEHRTPDVLSKLRSTQKLIKDAEIKAYINPEKAEEARLQGKEYFTKGDWPNAVKAYSEMIKRAPEDARGFSNRAAALAKLMSFPEAVKDASKAVELDPTFIRAYIRKASAEIALKDFAKAIETLDLARTKDLEVTKGSNAKEIDQLYSKAYQQRFQGSSANETPEQTFERASKDPEVAAILQDPVMNSILSQARDNPQALQEHMKNPEVARKVQILIAAGIIRTR